MTAIRNGYEPKMQVRVIEVCQHLFMKHSTVLLVQRIEDAIDVWKMFEEIVLEVKSPQSDITYASTMGQCSSRLLQLKSFAYCWDGMDLILNILLSDIKVHTVASKRALVRECASRLSQQSLTQPSLSVFVRFLWLLLGGSWETEWLRSCGVAC